jgi:hypothetical protein
MIQRAQSVYLLTVSILMSVMLVIPVFEFLLEQEDILILYGYGLKIYEGGADRHLLTTFPLLLLISSIAIISLINIFMFKKRVIQLRLCIFNILLQLGLLGLSFYYIKFVQNQFHVMYDNFKIGAIFPVIAIILTFLAFKGIRSDELLVRSYDRLR